MNLILGILLCAKAQKLCIIFKEFAGNSPRIRTVASLWLAALTVSKAYRHQQGLPRILKINTKGNFSLRMRKSNLKKGNSGYNDFWSEIERVAGKEQRKTKTRPAVPRRRVWEKGLGPVVYSAVAKRLSSF